MTERTKLKGSLKKHGLVDTLVWNARTGNIVGGHQRISALDDLEGGQDYKLVVQRIDVDETAEKQLNLALNNKTMQGQFEADLLKDLLAEFVADGVDLEGAGYTATDVQSMYPDIMFAGAMAQADVEADDVAMISNMATSGKEHEAEFRARMGQTGSMSSEPPRPLFPTLTAISDIAPPSWWRNQVPLLVRYSDLVR